MCNCNENGNVYNIGMGCCVPMIANPNAYYTKSEVDEKIASGGSITPQEVDDMIESAITGYATEQWVLDQNYISGVDLSDYATKAEIPTVPTNVSAFNNDVPYLTEHQSLSAYSTTEQMNNAITEATSGKAESTDVTQEIAAAVSGKADSISAGRGISISTANTISLGLSIFSGSGYDSIVLTSTANNGGNKATEYGCFVGGYDNNVGASNSMAYGSSLKTTNHSEAAFGNRNLNNSSSSTFIGSSACTVFTIGNGTSQHKHNAFDVRQNGDIYVSNTAESGGTYDTKPMIKLQDVLASLQSQIDELRSQIQ